jgi:hypothetical protein
MVLSGQNTQDAAISGHTDRNGEICSEAALDFGMSHTSSPSGARLLVSLRADGFIISISMKMTGTEE